MAAKTKPTPKGMIDISVDLLDTIESKADDDEMVYDFTGEKMKVYPVKDLPPSERGR